MDSHLVDHRGEEAGMARSDGARGGERHSRTRRSLLTAHWGTVLTIELAVAAAVVAFLIGGTTGYIVAGAVAVVTALLFVPIRGRSLIERIRLRLAYARRRPDDVDADVPGDLVPLAQWVPGLSVAQTHTGHGEEVGVITDGTAWTAVLSLTADDQLLADRGADLDLERLAHLTVQDDVVFAGVQIVTYLVPAPTSLLLGEDSAALGAYREILRQQPPPSVQRSFLCLRLDPRLCMEAVARRGATDDGIQATLRFGLHRVQSVLKRQGVETRALSPIEIHEVLSLTAGAGPEHEQQRTREAWSEWHCDGLVHRGRAVRNWGRNASIGYGALLESIAGSPVLFALASYTFSPTSRPSGGVRLVTTEAAEADRAVAHVESHLNNRLRFAPAGGQQVPMMLATVPLGRGV
ncbi:type VII secretion protein EccE [Parenemella sanctibonifatiensis]|uniref:Type VII secretion protein EccE n=1 Tax=Parenemella sanctibonifatiensis TaxID=2016505 RepID=A0A255ETI0_9ACTN|nr:type VII secretion protein EccE [Parenemella sanctibonifatiensis]OYN92742.1 type VII secretion protein EccE [Parenemella sanctibonifatiensis]